MKAHVVFATITGNNEDIADIVTEGLESLDVEVVETEISQTDPNEFKEADICVVCPYTYDEGHLPEEGMDFYEELKGLDLSGRVFGVAGSGDTYYEEFYNIAVDAFSDAFKAAKATPGAPNVKINLEPDADDIKTLDQFADQLVKSAQAK